MAATHPTSGCGFPPAPQESAARAALLQPRTLDGLSVARDSGSQVTATGLVQEGVVGLDFVGIDPETGKEGSPTVWVDRPNRRIVFQGVKAEEDLEAEIGGRSWAPDHEAGIPGHEAVVWIPTRMIPILRKACDDAERDGLL
ncbi:hypothetical protein GCM10010495_77260 [Kitasatospora herbaricolor]|uniref:hypothetical protein n=1 Tax=Kitasatospora herbaricolor TaxID=68217 RepID=UPI001987A0AC|nr:hypothetical protein [Kitasatospora herbaricolor]MDQ0305830.1 hypothetical protein [Kitasatospora herbaricolor]GGV48018.1 hypothetical protein GCM10010495_77260 [Kitasatospora herbaricolor]